jgi:L-aspartate oxidase
MSRHVGVVRDEASLAAAAAAVAEAAVGDANVTPSRTAFEVTNLLTVAAGVVAAAGRRAESRGCHRRSDHPEPRDEWRCRQTVTIGDDGGLSVTSSAVGS